MAKGPLKGGTDEQLDLIDTAPKNVKPLIAKAKQWRATIAKRLSLQETEKEQKADLRQLVADSELTPTDTGHIIFTYKGVEIKVDPMQEGKISVKVEEDE